MIQNYEYFLTLAETLNISHAAQKLYISHQCLSRYLKNLENECGLTLFERKPSFTLTYAGQVLLESLRDIQRIEQNTQHALRELKTGASGEIRLGVTEGRLRIFLPALLKSYRADFPDVVVRAIGAPTSQMQVMLQENKLDLALGGYTGKQVPGLEYNMVLEEDLYIVVSDNLLRTYFHDSYPACLDTFRAEGVDLKQFEGIPFCTAGKDFNSRVMLDNYLQKHSIDLNIIYEASQPDFLNTLTASDFACSPCLSMYLPNLQTLNRSNPPENQLHAFRIKGMNEKNPLFLISQRGKYFPQYTKAMIKLIRKQCSALSFD